MAKKLAAALRDVSGFAVLQSGKASTVKGMLAPDSALKNPHVSLLTIRQPWAQIMPTLKGAAVNLDFLNRQAERMRKLDKGYKLLPMSGLDSRPAFLKGEPPWSPKITEAWAVLCEQIDSALGADPAFRGLHVTAPTFDASAEAHTNGSPSAGYTAAGWRDAWLEAFEGAATALPASVSLIFSISVQPRAKQFVPAVCDALRAKYGQRIIFQHNALHARCASNPAHHKFVREQHAKGSRIGFEQVCSAFHDPQRYGSSDPMGPLRLAIKQGATFIDVYSPDVPKLKAWWS